ncbi:MAG: MBL fold metallo-hydrolase [Myxococcales bacterium]|nr:MBL fold metallo-hydrolase [Myxococcales bacterium]
MAFFNAPRWRGPLSDHFDGRRFRNTNPDMHHAKPRDLLKWMSSRERGPWRYVDTPPGPKPPERVEGDTMRVTFVGHATLLVQMEGLNVLTDPLFEPRTSPVSFAGPKRFRPPGIRFEDLPPIDLVLLSHNHYDHCCVPTLRRLAQTHGAPPIVTGLGNLALFEKEGIAGEHVELDWWQHVRIGESTVHFVEMQHFSGRGPADRDVTLWGGVAVEHPKAGTVLFCGDTGYGPHFARIRAHLGDVRLALVPIGAFRPRWFMRWVHVDPEESVRAHLDLGARTSVGMHFGTFALADDGQDEPLVLLDEARARHGVSPDAFVVLEHGAGFDAP